MRKNTLLTIITIIISTLCYSQTYWQSKNYKYSIEIPKEFSKVSAIGSNIDFKAVKELSSIVIAVNTLPPSLASYTLLEILGDLKTFSNEWEAGAREYMEEPKFLKYGETAINNLSAFWYDYKTERPTLYSKVYQTKKDNILYTITLTCPISEYTLYQAVWFRFKDNFKII